MLQPNIYIYIYSPSLDIDRTWRPVKDYIAKELKPHEREKYILIVMTQLNEQQ